MSSLTNIQYNNNELLKKKIWKVYSSVSVPQRIFGAEQFVEPHVINKVFFGCLGSVFPQYIRRAGHLPESGQRRGVLDWRIYSESFQAAFELGLTADETLPEQAILSSAIFVPSFDSSQGSTW